MLTGNIKSGIDSIWDYCAFGGLTNPIDVIKQLNYLIFFKRLDDLEIVKENEHNKLKAVLGLTTDEINNPYFSKENQNLRWHKLKENTSSEQVFELLQKRMIPFLKEMHGDDETVFSKYMENAVFQIPNPNVLQKVMDKLEEIFALPEMKDKDSLGDLYEYLLSKLSTSGRNGQFRTPKHLINMMVKMMAPKLSDTICDPACGTAGFIASSIDYIKENYRGELQKTDNYNHFHNDMFFAFDTDETMLGISAMNMILHGVDRPNLERKDSLSNDNTEEEKYSLILANPPFKGSLDNEQVNPNLLTLASTKKTELLFINLILRSLKLTGRAAVIVPDGVLFGSSNAHKAIRQELVEKQKLVGVVSLPSGVFKPYAGVSTGILIFEKTNSGGTEDVWFYDMTADGFSLDDKRNPLGKQKDDGTYEHTLEENNIPDVIERFAKLETEKSRTRLDKSFMVPKSDIVANDYDLSINRYKEVEHTEVEYDAPELILDKIEGLEKEIQIGLAELRAMLRG